jgi:mannose-1-phosphate guanylyltransferase/phosphomannomutase
VQRTKVDPQAIIAASARRGVALAGDGQGRYCFPTFQPAFDGMYAMVKLLEFLAKQHTSLAEVVRTLPRFHVSQAQVACPWQQKGRVMRLLNETQGGTERQIDGVMIDLAPDEWVLVLPDAERPLFHVYAEGPQPDTAAALAKRYADLVSELQR